MPTSISNDWLFIFLFYCIPNIYEIFLNVKDSKNIIDILYVRSMYIYIGFFDAATMCRWGLFDIIDRP